MAFIDSSSLDTVLVFWETVEYIAEGIVILACAGEFISEFTKAKTEEWRHELGKLSTLVLILGLSIGLIALGRTNFLSGLIIEQLRSENLRLEALIQPRSLTVEQQRDIGTSLLLFQGRKVILVSLVADPEGYNFTRQVLPALKLAKLDLQDNSGTMTRNSPIEPTGVQIVWPPAQKDLGAKLAEALDKIGKVRGLSLLPENTTVLDVSEPVRITVYSKPFDVLK